MRLGEIQDSHLYRDRVVFVSKKIRNITDALSVCVYYRDEN